MKEETGGDAVAAWLAGLERDPTTIRLDLEPLDRDAVARQLEAVAGSTPDAALVDRIHARSGGNPYFVEELYRWERSGAAGQLPRTLTETLIAQVAALSDASQAMLGIVAVGGRAVDERLVAAVAVGGVGGVEALGPAAATHGRVRGGHALEEAAGRGQGRAVGALRNQQHQMLPAPRNQEIGPGGFELPGRRRCG